MTSLSSAYYIIGKALSELPRTGRFRSPCAEALFTKVWWKSAASTKRSGERWSPCLTSLLQWKVFQVPHIVKTEDVPYLKIEFIQFYHVLPNPLTFISCSIASCSIPPNTFSKSNFKITISFFDCQQRRRYSIDHAKQSFIVLVLIKSYWLLWIKFLITLRNRFASSFMISFIEQIGREIGLKSAMENANTLVRIFVEVYSFIAAWKWY